MNILGISAHYHDSAAALIVDGEIVAAAQEERFSRIKHDADYPEQAIRFCLEYAKIEISDIEYVAFYEKPFLKFDRLLETYLAFAPKGFFSFSKAIPLWLKQKIDMRRTIKRNLGPQFNGKIVFPEHHESHSASAYFPSPFDAAAILTMDGVGEWATASIGLGIGNKIELIKELTFPHSLGLLYSSFTYHAGFKVNSGEYKLMGLAPFGKPVYTDLIKERLVDIKDDGSLWMDMQYFNYCHGFTMTSEKFDRLFGPARKPESPITQREVDMAASIQAVTEEIMLKMTGYVKKLTGEKNLCLAGGVALNCVGNGKVLSHKIFDNIWIQPAAGDAGASLGASLFVWYHLLENKRKAQNGDSQKGSLLGPGFSMDYIRETLDKETAVYTIFEHEDRLLDVVTDAIISGKVVGWFSGRMEFGPRALGGRSIVGDARNKKMQSIMNLKIKYRESFRPFAPCVLDEDAGEYFELATESPYMLLVSPVKKTYWTEILKDQKDIMDNDPDLSKRVNIPRSELPAITHVDYSARIQTVDQMRHGRYYELLKRFKEKTGCSVLINTSFNIRGEPIVLSPLDAFKCFMNTEMDVLVLDRAILYKEKQNHLASDVRKYKKEFRLD